MANTNTTNTTTNNGDAGIKCDCFTGVACVKEGACLCLPVGAVCEGSTKTYNTPQAKNIFDFTSVIAWMKAHPYIVIGGAAVIFFLLMARRRR